jgi:CheY-like chemotaxis protein
VSKVLHGTSYDAVLMDLQMPRMDGIEATQRIRADSRFSSLPVIAMTAHTLVEERDRCRQAGMNDFISKPIDPPSLYATLAHWTRNRGNSVQSSVRVEPPRPVKSMDDAIPALPGIDTSLGLKRVMNKPALYRKVLCDFYLRFNNVAAQIHDAMDRGDQEEANRQTHSAKGLSATIGAMALHEAAVSLEQALKGGSDPVPALHQFEHELAVVVAGLRSAFELDSPQ